MKGQRILIVTSSHLCRNPRVVKEATSLGGAGYDVTVLSISTSPRFAQIDNAMLGSLPFRSEVLDALTPSRWSSLATRAATWFARKACAHIGIESAAALGPAWALLGRARAIPSDLVIAHCEIPLWAAQSLRRDGRRVSVDFEDWYSEDLLPADRASRPLRLLRRSESFALRHCAYTSCTSESMASALASAYGARRPIVIRNSFPLQPTFRTAVPAGGAAPRFIWFSQTIGPGRGLENFFKAWALTRNPSKLCLMGDERPGYRRELLAMIPPQRRGDLEFAPLVPPSELPGRLSNFDVGLALEGRVPPNKDLTISNKLLQYMNAGLAIVASDTAGQREVLSAAPGCGILVSTDDSANFAAGLDELTGTASRLRAAQLASRTAAEREFCWEKESPHLLAAVAGALGRPIQPID